MPVVRVAIGRKGPPCAWPGFMSNVSVWLGPPFIHNNRQDRLRPPAGLSAAASALSQPLNPPKRVPSSKLPLSRLPEVAPSQSRRDNFGG